MPHPQPHAEPHTEEGDKTTRALEQGSEDASGVIAGAWHAFRGAGENIRGTINKFVDSVGDTISQKRDLDKDASNEAVIRGGTAEMEHGAQQIDRSFE